MPSPAGGANHRHLYSCTISSLVLSSRSRKGHNTMNTKPRIAYLPLIHPSNTVTKQTVHPKLAQTIAYIVNSDLPVSFSEYEQELVVTRMGLPFAYAQKIENITSGWSTKTVTVGIYACHLPNPSKDFAELEWIRNDIRDIVLHAVEIGYHSCIDEQMEKDLFIDKEFCNALTYDRLCGCDTEQPYKGFSRTYNVFDLCPSSTTGDVEVLVTNSSDKNAVVRLRKGGLKQPHEM